MPEKWVVVTSLITIFYQIFWGIGVNSTNGLGNALVSERIIRVWPEEADWFVDDTDKPISYFYKRLKGKAE